MEILNHKVKSKNNEINIELNNELDNESDDESDLETEENNNSSTKIITQITNKSIRSIYYEYLQDDSLLLSPEYQRELSWSIEKMNAFIDTILKGWIVPNYVIYQLSEKELKQNINHRYECIDGQHRLLTLKWYIEGIPYLGTNKLLYWKKNKERIYYNLNPTTLNEIKIRSRCKYKCRNLTKEEKQQFDNFQMCIHMVSSLNGLAIGLKCDIFNRLQNGEKVTTYDKLKNLHTNIITDTIRSNKMLKYLNDINFISKINVNHKKTKLKHAESFNIYFLIRSFLIIDKKNLNTNYLDMNIKKYLEYNNGNGSPCVQLTRKIDELYNDVKIIIEYIANNLKINVQIIPELAYIFVCIYANFGSAILDKVIDWLYNEKNKKQFELLNNINTYKKGVDKVTSSIEITKYYNLLLKYSVNTEVL